MKPLRDPIGAGTCGILIAVLAVPLAAPAPAALAPVADSGPPAENDERVNCVVDGVRQWTWRSRCE